jgi:hypothetical protein
VARGQAATRRQHIAQLGKEKAMLLARTFGDHDARVNYGPFLLGCGRICQPQLGLRHVG